MNNAHWPTLVGLAVGIILGLTAAFGGLTAFLLVLVLGAAGFVVGRVVETGEVNLSSLSTRRR
ncbi:DUF2273 domain-containing protein [Nonomuraea sp. B1E8]|uniref:DUF2273 domain-containing protein n=1 Tax=unclassified Nonomuraea TaxID=2593643 RepID=UPI00325EEC18